MREVLASLLALVIGALPMHAAIERADSVQALAYSASDGAGGLQVAWRETDKDAWQPLGLTLISSDFGPWGSHKKMWAPSVAFNPQSGLWEAVWVADPQGYVQSVATSADLKSWSPQIYTLSQEPRPEVHPHAVNGAMVMGSQFSLSRAQLQDLEQYAQERRKKAALYAETMASDPRRFANLEVEKYAITPQPAKSKAITDKLIGIFFEDINYAADGGLYAEMVQNRDFEYKPSDKGNDANWNSLTAWSFPTPEKGDKRIASDKPLHANNPHFLRVKSTETGYKIANSGYDGMSFKPGKYDFSAYARGKIKVAVTLRDSAGLQLDSKTIAVDSQEWRPVEATFDVARSADNGFIEIALEEPGQIDLDMVSLFPQATFKGRKNGLRADLAQALADLHPRFVRFPGGCVAHGDGIDNIYDWKGSIGPLYARKPLKNLWGYHQSRGLGYHEYFLFCEDIGAEPLPVLAAGVPCQNSGTAAHHTCDPLTRYGQQGGIPMAEMDAYIQDILDLIEYANGPIDSEWGAKRAEAGHPEPFGLKYLGIGNEDMITPVFEERFNMIYDAVRAAHPEIEIVGTVGPFYEGTDYEQGWRLAAEKNVPWVDEHYYVAPGWLIYNQDFYDRYPRGATKVYLGEWAAHLDGRPSNMETALAEALYLTAVERNGDVVSMTSYAPLLAKEGHTQWRPDLIYFNNSDLQLTTDYYVQQLYGQNSGTKYVPAAIDYKANIPSDDGVVGYAASQRVGSSIVQDAATGDYIIKLVNLLPKVVPASVDLKPLKAYKLKQAVRLAGAPTDTQAVPVDVSALVSVQGKQLDCELPPYSFTVIRLKR